MKRLGALAALFLLGAAAPTPLLLRAQAWTVQSENLAHDLTHAPRECSASLSPQAEAGRALFRSPALLGGPAARLGLSCNACHSNGRVNTRFFLPELTNRPGAADVTSEWASHVRGDGVMNPVDIPDLAGAGDRSAFGHIQDPSLEHFVRSVITEEFQGAPPPDESFESLIAYVRQLDSCTDEEAPITLQSASEDVRRSLTAAEAASDPAAASLLVLAAQDGLGRIVERLPQHGFAHERRGLESLARELGAMRSEDIRSALNASLPGWRARFDAIVSRLARCEQRTYFNEATLRAALAQ